MNPDFQELMFPQSNDVIVTVVFTNITDGTGAIAEFYRKPRRTTPDTDSAVKKYTSAISQVDGKWQAVFNVPRADNAVSGSSWWKVDAISSGDKRRTAAAGPLVIGAV